MKDIKDKTELASLVEEIEEALERHQVVRFNRLIQKRSRIIHNLFDGRDVSQLPPDLLSSLVNENQRWLKRSQIAMNLIKDKIRNLKSTKKSAKQLSYNYQQSPPAGQFLSNRG